MGGIAGAGSVGKAGGVGGKGGNGGNSKAGAGVGGNGGGGLQNQSIIQTHSFISMMGLVLICIKLNILSDFIS